MVYYQKMTPEGYKQIEDEIERLKKTDHVELKFCNKLVQWETYLKIQNILKLNVI